tara:strand:+ start:732 stop:893 length:162 start_codon:yes stop_codon:yes gene_type:complete
MREYHFTRIEKIKSIQIIQAKTEEQAKKQLEIEGFDESCDEIISSNTEIEEKK